MVAEPEDFARIDRAGLLNSAATPSPRQQPATRPGRAAALWRRLLARWIGQTDPLRAARLLVGLSWAMRSQCGDPVSSLPIAQGALSLLPTEPPIVERAMALSEPAVCS